LEPEHLESWAEEQARFRRKLWLWERTPSHLRKPRPKPPELVIVSDPDDGWLVIEPPAALPMSFDPNGTTGWKEIVMRFIRGERDPRPWIRKE
jgi:hypothetical protein